MNRKKIATNRLKLEVENFIIMGKGNKIAISTSKIKKITAIKKKRKEKGKRGEQKGSNPHSKGEDFSRSKIIFLERFLANSMINKAKKRIIIKKINIIKIFYS